MFKSNSILTHFDSIYSLSYSNKSNSVATFLASGGLSLSRAYSGIFKSHKLKAMGPFEDVARRVYYRVKINIFNFSIKMNLNEFQEKHLIQIYGKW